MIRNDALPTTIPRLPRVAQGLAGPIRVLRPVDISSGTAARRTAADWDWEHRIIRVRSTLPRRMAWQLFVHELAHAALDDLGIALSDNLEEQVCEAMAAATLAFLTRHDLSATHHG